MNNSFGDFFKNLDKLVFDNYITFEEMTEGYCLEKEEKKYISQLSKEFRIKKSDLNEGYVFFLFLVLTFFYRNCSIFEIPNRSNNI